MKRCVSFGCVMCLLIAASFARETGRPVTIKIDATQKAGLAIPRTIFGSFLEPIGNSTYNGLWAEILQNPSFEENLWSAPRVVKMLQDEPSLSKASSLGLPLPWGPLDVRQGNRYEPRWGDAANSWRSLEIIGVPGQPTGVKQKIFLPIHRELRYTGSFYAKHLSGSPVIHVALRLRDRPDQVLANADIPAAAANWKKYMFTLSLPAGKLQPLEPADFVLQVESDERTLLDQASLMPADAIDGLDPDIVRMAKEMHTPLVRFGGNFTSAYHWRDGVGPRDKRVSMLNIAWGIPEYNTFGTDEFLRFCDLIGAQPQVALNLGSGTPSEAGDWVRYVDQHWKQHSGLLWELGNELWGNWNLGSPTLEQLPGRTLQFSKAVRAVDPHARLIATGQDPDHFEKWNAAQLTNPPGTFDFLSTHFVVRTDHLEATAATPGEQAAAAFGLPVELGRRLRAMQDQIDRTPGYRNKTHIAFTEWLFHGGAADSGVPQFTNMGGAVIVAGFFNMLLKNADIVPISDMTGIVEFAGIWKKRGQVYGVPSYYAFRMYATADADRTVAVTNDAGTYNIEHGVTRLPDIKDVPYLDTVAVLNKAGARMTIFCVNRQITQDIPATINLSGFAAASTGKVQALSASNIDDVNDETKPEAIKPIDSEIDVAGDHLQYVFRHESVTRIELNRRP
ncbi:MAG: alpha-L-arabinofuranosidase C-terminal domain-containing protein [Bryobacteraceae bacterium]